MSEKDFDLDVKISVSEPDPESNITSHIACTAGCITGIIMTCPLQTATCGCQSFGC